MNYTYKTWFKYVIIYGNNQIGCLIVSKISDDCKSTCGLPLPDDFPFKETYFENQLLTLISSAGESISGATPSA